MKNLPLLPDRFETVYEHTGATGSRVTVAVSLHNYEEAVLHALHSVKAQTLRPLDLVVVDDHSSDDGLSRVIDWASSESPEFNSVKIVTNDRNSGLARTRNLAFDLAAGEFVFVLDADNLMYPRCLERLLTGIEETDLAFVWGIGRAFGEAPRLISSTKWDPRRLAIGPYIDAAALVRRDAWLLVGGYHDMPAMGWEDYDFYCRMHEHDFAGQLVPEILWLYRTHGESMLHKLDEKAYEQLRIWMTAQHPWLIMDW